MKDLNFSLEKLKDFLIDTLKYAFSSLAKIQTTIYRKKPLKYLKNTLLLNEL